MRLPWPIALLAGCGRVAFDPLADARPGDGAVDDSPGSSDLLLHLAFDDADLRLDSAVAPHNGSCTACPTQTAGRVGTGAAMFDATSCLELPGTRDLQPAAFTFAAWLRPRIDHTGTVFGRTRDGATSESNSWEIWVENTPAWNVSVRSARTGGIVVAGQWHHYAGSYDGATLNVYVDGALSDTRQIALGQYTLDDLAVGCDLNFGARVQRFDGAIDDVRLYGRALGAAEVAVLAQ